MVLNYHTGVSISCQPEVGFQSDPLPDSYTHWCRQKTCRVQEICSTCGSNGRAEVSTLRPEPSLVSDRRGLDGSPSTRAPSGDWACCSSFCLTGTEERLPIQQEFTLALVGRAYRCAECCASHPLTQCGQRGGMSWVKRMRRLPWMLHPSAMSSVSI